MIKWHWFFSNPAALFSVPGGSGWAAPPPAYPPWHHTVPDFHLLSVGGVLGAAPLSLLTRLHTPSLWTKTASDPHHLFAFCILYSVVWFIFDSYLFKMLSAVGASPLCASLHAHICVSVHGCGGRRRTSRAISWESSTYFVLRQVFHWPGAQWLG